MAGITFKASPVGARFMNSNAFGRIFAGPVGSGKTTHMLMEVLRRACEQHPGDDGISYTRFAVVRQTLKQLKDTVLPECRSWLGNLGEWKVSDSTFYINFDNVQCEMPFIPLEDAEDQARLLSMQLTGAWLNECIEMDISVLKPISGRLNRYPSGKRGVPTWTGMIGDTNMPTEMTPWHDFMQSIANGEIKDWQFFRQPSGLDPEAENLNFLAQTEETIKLPYDHPDRIARGRMYYQRLVDMYGIDSDWIKRYVRAEYGDDPSGLAVYRETFRRAFHVVEDTNLIPGYPLLIGQDFGRNPWSLIAQVDHMGRVIIHEEVQATNMGLEKHINQNLRPVLMREKYLGWRVAMVGDPSGVAKGSVTEESNFDALKRMGFPAFPAVTNDLDPRLRAVEYFLTQQTNGGPSLIINGPKCPVLVRGLDGGYRFVKTKQGAVRPVPDKNGIFSHVQDDLQYICLVARGGMMEVIAHDIAPRSYKMRPPMPAGAWT